MSDQWTAPREKNEKIAKLDVPPTSKRTINRSPPSRAVYTEPVGAADAWAAGFWASALPPSPGYARECPNRLRRPAASRHRSRSTESLCIRDARGQVLAYVYFEDETGRRMAMKQLTRDEARRIAADIAKLPGWCADLSRLSNNYRIDLLIDQIIPILCRNELLIAYLALWRFGWRCWTTHQEVLNPAFWIGTGK